MPEQPGRGAQQPLRFAGVTVLGLRPPEAEQGVPGAAAVAQFPEDVQREQQVPPRARRVARAAAGLGEAAVGVGGGVPVPDLDRKSVV